MISYNNELGITESTYTTQWRIQGEGVVGADVRPPPLSPYA